jgi:hypothetical protein
MAGRIIVVIGLLVFLTIVYRDLSLPPASTAVVKRALDIKTNSLPVEWPAASVHVRRVSTVVDNYFPARGIQDSMSQSGFAHVTRSARELNEKKSHLVWKAHVTTSGLEKLGRVFLQIVPDLRSDPGQVTGMVLHN